jgi:hypothetical protein
MENIGVGVVPKNTIYMASSKFSRSADLRRQAHIDSSCNQIEVIMQNIPAKRKLSEVLDEIGRDDELADRIEAASIEMRRSKMSEAKL